eukprot:9502047-Pyramimonas_sp.AAC.1
MPTHGKCRETCRLEGFVALQGNSAAVSRVGERRLLRKQPKNNNVWNKEATGQITDAVGEVEPDLEANLAAEAAERERENEDKPLKQILKEQALEEVQEAMDWEEQKREREQVHNNDISSFYGSSCANNGKGALNTPEERERVNK